MNLLVIGTGYVGLTTGVCLAEKGNTVTCVDINEKKIETLKKGISYLYEIGLQDLLQKNLKNEKLKFITTTEENCYTDKDVVFICINTPKKENGDAELKYVYSAIDEMLEKSNKDEYFVVIKSTVPIGTCEQIQSYINEHCKDTQKIEVVSNPEFLSQGRAVEDTLETQRIIIGAESEKAQKTMLEIYKNFKQEKIVTTKVNAEMIKYVSNSFLALKISYINSMANLCEKLRGRY